jgi:Peptidase inhibitor family I36
MLKTVAISALLLACLTGSSRAEDPVGTSGGPVIPFPGCIAWEHRDFRGAKFTFRGNVNVSYVGSRWNDKISSFACAGGCRMTFFEHRDFQGDSRTWGSGISYVGSRWNDRISSLFVRCG